MTSLRERVGQTLAPRGRVGRVLAALAFVTFSAACDDSSGPQRLETLTVTPATVTLATGGTQQFTVAGTDTDGGALTIDGETWSVSGGGTINATTGLFTAGTTAGTFTVSVTCNGEVGTATVIVSPGALATITVTPNPTLAIGATQQFTAVGRDVNGNVVAIVPVWSTVNPPGTINAGTGLFTAGNTTGTFNASVRATSGAIFGTANVTVIAGPLASITVTPDPATLQTGATQQFTAVGRDAGGNVIPITPVWTVNTPPGGGSINSSSGLYTAGGTSGTFTNSVRATSGTIFDEATVIVMSAGAPPAPGFTLGSAAPFGILAGSTVTCAGAPGTVNAWVGVSPGTAMTGFPPCTITGEIHLGDAVAATAQNDLTTAYNTLAGLPCGTVVGTVNIGSTTRQPGVYCSGTSMLVTGDITLDALGDPNATFVFQAGSTLTTAGSVILIGGAQAQNVYWQVGSSATLAGGPATWRGNVLADQSITLNNNVTLIGRALTRIGAVTLGTSNTITLP